jgi:fumarate hydratase, class I
MPEFTYTELLPTGADDTEYRRLDVAGGSTRQSFGRNLLNGDPGVLTLLTREAIRDIAHLLRPGHLRPLRSVPADPEASPNDRHVALGLLKNACIAPLTMWAECNTGSNRPAQIEIYAPGGGEYTFLLMAKGGGMEAVWRIEVRDVPAFIIVDGKGNDFLAGLGGPVLTIGRR